MENNKTSQRYPADLIMVIECLKRGLTPFPLFGREHALQNDLVVYQITLVSRLSGPVNCTVPELPVTTSTPTILR